jgi:hypothetical protein
MRECFYCGPYKPKHGSTLQSHTCPTCGLDPIEVRAIERVREFGFEACYREEVANAKRRGGSVE